MDEAGLRAARAIFKGKNESQPDGTIDLHGLHVKEAEMIVKEELAAAKKKGSILLFFFCGRIFFSICSFLIS
jgi:DNA-nicking Smr family endonuclease